MSQPQNELIKQDLESPESNEGGIDLLGLVQILGEEKSLLLGLPFFCASVAALISLYLTPMYTAKATFVVPEKQASSASVALEQLGGLAGSLSKSPTDMYMAFMQSKTVQDEIIADLDLMQRYQMKTQEDTRKILLSRVKIITDKKSGLITIEAQDQLPNIAAKLANAYLKPIRVLLNRMSLEETQLRRDFFAQQIALIAQRPFRDPFVQSTLLSSMIRQYEQARIDEARESQILFQVDVAKSPEKKSSPLRIQLVLLVGLASLSLTILLIFIKRALRHAKNDLASSQKWVMMKEAWRFRS